MTTEKLAENKDTLAALERLAENEDFKHVFLPYLQARATFHAEQCRSRDLTMEKRSEHIEAAALAEELVKYLGNRQKTLERKIAAAKADK